MILPPPTALRRASSRFRTYLLRDLRRGFAAKRNNALQQSITLAASSVGTGGHDHVLVPKPSFVPAESSRQVTPDREFFLSVLGTSVTKRDARGYMNKFIPLLERKGATSFKQQASQLNDTVSMSTTVSDGQEVLSDLDAAPSSPVPLYVALVVFRAPQQTDDTTLLGVGRTLDQLRKLGLISVVVLDCNTEAQNERILRRNLVNQASRIATAIDRADSPGARVIESPMAISNSVSGESSPFVSDNLFISNSSHLMTCLQEDIIPIVPSLAVTDDLCTREPVNANEAVKALARQLSGLQFMGQSTEDDETKRVLRSTEVYRLIILDPLGGIPAKDRATGRHMFLNLEQEFDEVATSLAELTLSGASLQARQAAQCHLNNAELANTTLTLLPPTSSAVITTPQDAASTRSPDDEDVEWLFVGTRTGMNPLIHNLLTDKPIQSSSLPSGRIRPVACTNGEARMGSLTTLAKRGMPLTIFPDPREGPWRPPQPGATRLSLTDPHIDLGRLVHLIEDSFGRKLDVEHYLRRVDQNLAGIIIAGEYEGGAILTWEKPFGADSLGNVDSSRLVPYLDKFAVLRKSQGAGGVADIVFNAMVRDCFVDGVCWRSRKNNPVNKWYFERSRGVVKLKESNWAMFWTTPDLTLDEQKYHDYESVCRDIGPSWADTRSVLE